MGLNMSNRRYDEEEKISLKYFYPYKDNEQPVLKNKLNIKDQTALDIAETNIISAVFSSRPKLNSFSLKEIQQTHKYLFMQIYDWGGKIRDYTTGRGKTSFARPEMIESYYNSVIFNKLKNENYLIGTNQDTFIKRCAYFLNEFNAVHPFIDGNGRMTRIFLTDLAEKSGYKLNTEFIKKDDWYKAMEVGFTTGNTELIENEIKKCFKISMSLTLQEQQLQNKTSSSFIKNQTLKL